MKLPTSWTSQEAMRKCPRRFKYRYNSADPTGQLAALRKLMSIRELAGHVIHMEMAKVVRRVASGERISDQDQAPALALRDFGLIIEQSQHTSPGILHGGIQVAEIFNGYSCSAEIDDWNDKIPVAVENGLRLAHYFDFRGNQDGYRLEAEQRNNFFHRGKDHRFVIDVLVSEGLNTSVIDWKTHDITNTDRRQVALYQHHLLKSRQISPTRLYGFVADLLHEQIVEHHYRSIEHTFAEDRAIVKAPTSTPAPAVPALADDYPTRPSIAACGICPFASICPDSAITINLGLGQTLEQGVQP